MDCSLEKESNALAGLFQNIICDLKGGQAVWDDLIQKTVKFSGQLKLTIGAVSGFVEALQRVADMATAAKGATREIGSTLTRLCIRHREVEEHLKKLTNSLVHCLATPLQEKMDDWRRVVTQMDRDHGKGATTTPLCNEMRYYCSLCALFVVSEFKRNRNEIRKRIGDKLRLQKKLRKGSLSMQSMVDTVVNDIKNRSNVLLSAEQQSLRQAMIEQRAQFCYFISCFKPIMDEELALLGEIAHMQELVEQLCRLTADPYTLPAASEAVIIDVKGLENTWRFQTPPSSPGSSYGSRKSSFCSLTSVDTINNQPMAIAVTNNSSTSAIESNATATLTTTNINANANNNANNNASSTVHANDKKYGKFARHSSAISEDSGFLSRDSLVPTASCFRNTLAAAQLKNILSDDDPEVVSTGPEEEDSQQSTPSPSPSLATWPDGSRSGSLASHEQVGPKPTVPSNAGDRPHTISAGFTDARQTLLHRRLPIDESVFCRNAAGVKIKGNTRVSTCFGSFVPRQKPPLPPRVSSGSSSTAPRPHQQRSNNCARAEQPVYCNLPTCPAPADGTAGRRPLSYAGGTTNSDSYPTHTSSFTGRPLFSRSTKTAAESEEDTLIHECMDEIDQLSSDLDRYATTKRVDVRSTGVVASPSFKSFCTMSRMVGLMRKETDSVDVQLKSRNLTKIDEIVEAQEPSSQSVVSPTPDVPSPPPQPLTHPSDSEFSQNVLSTRPTLAVSPPTPPPFPDFLKKSSQKAGSSKTDEVNGSFTTLSIGSYQQTEKMMVMKRRSYVGRAPPPPPPIRRNSEITSATVRAPPVDLVRCGSRCTTPIEETYSSVICALNARLAAVALSSSQPGQSTMPAGRGMVENHHHHQQQQHHHHHHQHHRRHSERVDVETTESAASTSTTISKTLQNTFYSLPCTDCSPGVVQVAQFNGDIGINRV
ncbi:Metastasis suppressor protein 1 [Trichinella zimbabwensis]|uniref:Metastasis suppressor protein 1 n=1 Tax=Trichinella zimbabwensis TaxID=268475 RepID=A0A0V1HN34_9BILA|nr:Metastasis suppressor protein 1 [Trichinella zimbabwensis]